MTKPERTKPEGLKVKARKMRFDFEETGFDRHWHSGNPFISHFWSSLSQAFGPGEKFFIDSVRAMRGEIDDPELIAEMEEFVRQEAAHTLQHRKFNRMVGALGYDVERLERRYGWVLDLARKSLDAKGMLSVTMALEHFTAGFAHQYFKNPKVAEGADPNVVALWAWHAAEEIEHKSTAFDVWQKLGGGYVRRVSNLVPSWFLIFAITLVNTADMMAQDEEVEARDVLEGLRYLFGKKGLVTGMVPTFLAYLSPNFFPWQEDDSADIAAWQADNARYLETEPSPRRTKAKAPKAVAQVAAA